MVIELIDSHIDDIRHQHFVSTDKVIDMLLDIRLVCSSTVERTNEGENELQEELVALIGSDSGVSEPTDSPALAQE